MPASIKGIDEVLVPFALYVIIEEVNASVYHSCIKLSSLMNCRSCELIKAGEYRLAKN